MDSNTREEVFNFEEARVKIEILIKCMTAMEDFDSKTRALEYLQYCRDLLSGRTKQTGRVDEGC